MRIMMDDRLLVVKDENHSANPDMGLVIPLSHYNLDGSLSDIAPGEFPNGAIFVSKNFLSMNQSFKNDEIFILMNILKAMMIGKEIQGFKNIKP